MLVSNAGFPWHLAGTGALFVLGLAILTASDARVYERPSSLSSHMKYRTKRGAVVLLLLVGCTGLAGYLTQQAAEAELKILLALQLSASSTKSGSSSKLMSEQTKAQSIKYARESIAINPHYRRLTAVVAERFASAGDWESAVWILESIVASRPHVVALWSGLTQGYTELGRFTDADIALHQVQRLKPDAIRTKALEINLLSKSGRDQEAQRLLMQNFDRGSFDFDMTQTGYAIGYKTRNWPLVMRSLTLRNDTWPEQAADGHFRLGKLFLQPDTYDTSKALDEFRSGLESVPRGQKDDYISQVPEPIRAQIEKPPKGGF
jgi:hypothetical protein